MKNEIRTSFKSLVSKSSRTVHKGPRANNGWKDLTESIIFYKKEYHTAIERNKKHLSKASYNNSIYTGEKFFCSCPFWGFMSHFFSGRVKKLKVYSFCIIFLSISQENKTKGILFIGIKPVFLYRDVWFGVAKCKFILKNSSSKYCLCFCLLL